MSYRETNKTPSATTARPRRSPALLWLAGTALLAGCGQGSTDGGVAPATQAVQQQGGGSGGGAYTVDMDAIFPQGEGRSLVLNNCQNCHTWVPIVILQMNEQEWDRWAREHRQRVEGLSDDEFGTLLAYVKANFNPDTPVPELPPALLEAWTTY